MKGKITLITGGQRSGKSLYGQELALKNCTMPVYLATAKIWDEDFYQRVERHRKDRGNNWQTIEEEIEISKHNFSGKTVMLDCITLWLTNIFTKENGHIERSLEIAKNEWIKFCNQNMCLIVITNELGMGVHPENEIARKFADLQGWFNQYLAKMANEVFLMVSGIPVKVK